MGRAELAPLQDGADSAGQNLMRGRRLTMRLPAEVLAADVITRLALSAMLLAACQNSGHLQSSGDTGARSRPRKDRQNVG